MKKRVNTKIALFAGKFAVLDVRPDNYRDRVC